MGQSGRPEGSAAERVFATALSWPPLSRLTGWVADRRLPSPVLAVLVRGYARLFEVDLSEVAEPVETHRTFNAFFTRRLRAGARPLDATPGGVISQRYRLGPLGRGVPDPTDVSATTDAAGNVTIRSFDAVRGFQVTSDGTFVPLADGSTLTKDASGAMVLRMPGGALVAFHPDGRFDGKWFEIRLTATYSDTNSVGNVYFANYVSWVGKARELFFRRCMPDFDLKDTPFYILTRNFNHKFVREAREFEEIIVRLRIKTYNRKFVKLEHQLFNSSRQLLGEGEQSLMFVTTDNYSLTDIPSDVVVAFTPHV